MYLINIIKPLSSFLQPTLSTNLNIEMNFCFGNTEWQSNPGPLDEKRERFLCAVHQFKSFFEVLLSRSYLDGFVDHRVHERELLVHPERHVSREPLPVEKATVSALLCCAHRHCTI